MSSHQQEQEQQQISDWPRFREAPAFRNGKECTTIVRTSHRHGSSGAPDADTIGIDICDSRLVHIAMTLDIAYIRGSMAAVLSIVQHATCPENVALHFVTSSLDRMEDLSRLIALTFPYLAFRLYPFNASLVKEKISPTIREALEQPLNYARAYLGDILPACVGKVIYLDSDVIVLDDIAELWRTDLEGRPLGAAEHCRANFTRYFTDGFWRDTALSGSAFGPGRRESACYFNTGVMVMDLGVWRSGGYTREIERWMEVQRERRIYELGSLPPFLLVFAGRLRAIEERWNQHGLGGDNIRGVCRGLHPGPISLLHWSGKGKPWVRLDAHTPCPLDSLWAPYDLALVWDKNFE